MRIRARAKAAFFTFRSRFPRSDLVRTALFSGVLRSAGPDAYHLKLPLA